MHDNFLVSCTGFVDRLWCRRPACRLRPRQDWHLPSKSTSRQDGRAWQPASIAEESNVCHIVQRFRPDDFFTAAQQARLQELMSRFHDAYDTGQDLAPEEKQELACLVDDEWQAAIERGAAILRQVPRSAA